MNDCCKVPSPSEADGKAHREGPYRLLGHLFRPSAFKPSVCAECGRCNVEHWTR